LDWHQTIETTQHREDALLPSHPAARFDKREKAIPVTIETNAALQQKGRG